MFYLCPRSFPFEAGIFFLFSTGDIFYPHHPPHFLSVAEIILIRNFTQITALYANPAKSPPPQDKKKSSHLSTATHLFYLDLIYFTIYLTLLAIAFSLASCNLARCSGLSSRFLYGFFPILKA